MGDILTVMQWVQKKPCTSAALVADQWVIASDIARGDKNNDMIDSASHARYGAGHVLAVRDAHDKGQALNPISKNSQAERDWARAIEGVTNSACLALSLQARLYRPCIANRSAV